MQNLEYLFKTNSYRHDAKMKNAQCVFICNDGVFGAEQVKKLIAFINGVHAKYKTVNMPIYIYLGEVNIIDKLSYIILECICYALINNYNHAVSVLWKPENNITTQGVFSSPLAIINTLKAKVSRKFLEKFKSDIFRYHFRKVVSPDNIETNYVGKLQQEINSFLSTFYIEENYRDDIVEMIGEIVGNVAEHAMTDCLLDIDVTTDHIKNDDIESTDSYYGINIVIMDFSDVLFGDKIKGRLIDNNMSGDRRYELLNEAYNYHKSFFSKEYSLEDFANLASLQHKISGSPEKGRAGGQGLTKLIKSLQDKSDMDNCYILSGNRVVYFKKDTLSYDDDEWLGFNGERDFFNKMPDGDVISHCIVNFPGTAYNLNFVMKREVKKDDNY